MSLGPRPSFDETWLAMAVDLSARGDCTRRRIAAILVKDNRIVGHGYNGMAPGKPGCLQGACPRGRLSYDELAAYASYDIGPGRCRAVHAEINCIASARPEDRPGSCIYVTDEPCAPCTNAIERFEIARVVIPGRSWNVTA